MKKPYRYHVMPCSGPRCTPEVGESLKAALKDSLADRKVLGIRVSTTSCQGLCEHGPNVAVYPEGIIYHQVTLGDLDRIISEHLRGGSPVEDIAARRAPSPGDN